MVSHVRSNMRGKVRVPRASLMAMLWILSCVSKHDVLRLLPHSSLLFPGSFVTVLCNWQEPVLDRWWFRPRPATSCCKLMTILMYILLHTCAIVPWNAFLKIALSQKGKKIRFRAQASHPSPNKLSKRSWANLHLLQPRVSTHIFKHSWVLAFSLNTLCVHVSVSVCLCMLLGTAPRVSVC